MARIITILIILALAAGYAHAIGVGGEGLRFGRVGATAGKATSSSLVSCASTGIFNLSNVCNDVYFIGALK
jgi:hypothetical protein